MRGGVAGGWMSFVFCSGSVNPHLVPDTEFSKCSRTKNAVDVLALLALCFISLPVRT